MEKELKTLENVSIDISKAGGRVFYVGGYVRDRIIGKESKDIDVEVYNISPLKLKEILSKYGEVDEIGASFGILLIKGLDIDFAMPRLEKKIGLGHKGFDVSVNPYMSFREASERRDITINSMMEDVLTGEIIDCFGGEKDLGKGIIKHINDATFIEDALRVLRVCQFASRFGFSVDAETLRLCKTIDVRELPKERIFEEIKKALLKSARPSIAFELMRQMGLTMKLFKQLHELPEDSWNETMRVVNEASKYKNGTSDPLAFLLAALCSKINNVEDLLLQFTDEKILIKNVLDLLKNHDKTFVIYKRSDSLIRRFMVESINPKDIVIMSIIVKLGKKSKNNDNDYDELAEFQKWFFNKIDQQETNLIPLVTGKDLIEKGFKQGKELGKALKDAYNLQIEGLSREEIIKEIIIK